MTEPVRHRRRPTRGQITVRWIFLLSTVYVVSHVAIRWVMAMV